MPPRRWGALVVMMQDRSWVDAAGRRHSEPPASRLFQVTESQGFAAVARVCMILATLIGGMALYVFTGIEKKLEKIETKQVAIGEQLAKIEGVLPRVDRIERLQDRGASLRGAGGGTP